MCAVLLNLALSFPRILWEVYSRPVAVLTNFYKLCGLKQHQFIILRFWRSVVQNQCRWADVRVSGGLQSFWRLQERLFPSLFGFLGAPAVLGSWPLLLTISASGLPSSLLLSVEK